MVPPGWDEEADEWTDEDEFGEEDEFLGDDDDYLDDDDYDDEENGEEEEEDELDSLISEGDALIEEGEYEGALELFREAVERFPESTLAAYKNGHTALMLFSDGVDESNNWEDDDEMSGYYEESLNAFDIALSIDEKYYPALNGQGALYMLADNIEGAIECWEQSLDIAPGQEDISSAMEEARAQLED